MSIEPTCDFCGASDKHRCKTETRAKGCELYTRKHLNLDPVEEFGFSFVDEAELENKNMDQVKSVEERLDTLYKTVEVFLDNLSQNPEKTTIKWPNRAEKIAEFKQKLKSIVEGE